MNKLELLNYKEIKENIDKILKKYLYKVVNNETLDNIKQEIKSYLSTLDLININNIDFILEVVENKIIMTASNEYTKVLFNLLRDKAYI